MFLPLLQTVRILGKTLNVFSNANGWYNGLINSVNKHINIALKVKWNW